MITIDWVILDNEMALTYAVDQHREFSSSSSNVVIWIASLLVRHYLADVGSPVENILGLMQRVDNYDTYE